MGALMRSTDWSTTPVGPPETWPQSLRTALSILLETGFPMYIAWGAEFTQFYNDGYRPILGSTKHPAAMGRSTRETFAEIWHIIGPMFEGVMEGRSFSLTDFLLPLDRHGFVEECYFVFSYSPVREESGNVGGVLVTVFETTERVLGARRLAILQELASQSQQALDATAACAIAGTVLASNFADAPFALIYTLDPPRGEPVLAGWAWPSGDPSSHAAVPELAAMNAQLWPIAEVCSTRQPTVVQLEASVRRVLAASADGPHPSRAIVLPIFALSSGQPCAVLVAGLSPRLPWDEAYRSFYSLVAGHIGSAIASATALTEARARAQALAAIDLAKTRFFSNVSHEFRTPLTLLLGPAEDALAAPEDLTSEQHERWSIVHRNALRLSKLVNTLLDFARIEAGRIQARYQPTDLAGLTAELVSMFRSAFERAGLRLALEVTTGGELAYVDREMWEKIVLNLLSNALKFTFEGEARVTLNLAGEYFELAVQDTGIGIPHEQLPFVFDRFHRVLGAPGRTHEGSGIGLALVAELSQLLGGDARVESTEGKGTCFSVRVRRGHAHLPKDRIVASLAPSRATRAAEPYLVEALRSAAQPTEQARALVAAAAPEPATSPLPEARARIILADDNADMREYLGRLLQERWDVEAVNDGAAALAALRRQPADLVLTDVMMPVLDGFGLLREVRADPQLRLTPVLLLSARAGEEATEDALHAGADDYIVKPFSARDLLVRIASKLAVARVAREARAIEDAQRTNLYRHFMQAPFPIAVFKGARHVVELANPLTLRAWGKGPEIIGLPLAEGMPELHDQPFLGWLDRVFATGVAHEGKDEPAYLPSGPNGELEQIYCNFVYAPLRDASGSVEGVLLSAFIVTEQVLARQELERALQRAESSEAQFRELVETFPQLAWEVRPDGSVSFCNRRWYDYTGLRPEDVERSGWLGVLEASEAANVLACWRQALTTGRMFELEFRLRGADGSYRWFLTRAIPLRDAGGTIVRWVGTNTDVDDVRRERERTKALATQLSLATQRLHAAQRTAKIGIFEWNFVHHGMRWSPEVYWLMGLAPEARAPTPKAWLEAVFAEDRTLGWSALCDAIAQRKQLLELELRLRQPSGDARWVRVSAELKYDALGAPLEMLGAAIDIQMLKEASDVRQRALEEAERTGRAKDEFLATMSHELRTPLHAILGWAKLLQNKAHDEQKLRHGLAVIERNADAQARLISDLLDVSRIVSGKLRLTMQLLDVSVIVRAALDVVRPAADAKGVQLATELDSSAGSIVGDPDRLQQIVWNLLTNAIKFTPSGGRVTVAAMREASRVAIDVHDTGTGIAPEYLRLIFDRFQQVDSSTTRKHGGLGLGLAIVRHLAEAHGGSVSAHSDGPGTGSRFRVTLPLRAVFAAPAPAPAADSEWQQRHRLAGPPARLRGARILVVDDDADSLELVRVVLEDAGALVVAASSAAVALAELQRQRFSLVVSDIGMPDTDGYEFMRIVRERNEHVAALALTAYARAEDAALARQAGFQCHMAKPVDAGELVESIIDLLGQPCSV
ncbi:MAG: Sensor protein [Myxococcaceae bacterium]|nr:Sensor protein [Myxococcaceae bacterium]